ncbi:SCO4226 family nickel-binding protein [Streptomyces sp. NPDC005209]|uniref:SCO4226 family nickel-binding protein n=1 Tax=Streptomyces sp. NPDC005209 TaxID=3156715 RepID=UPI0033BB7548
MTQFMDVHHGMQGITDEELQRAHEADLAIEKEEGVHFERAWADPVSGTVYCLSDAPSAEAVQRIHERAGHPADEIRPVPLSIW